jgi:hypothetical protein
MRAANADRNPQHIGKRAPVKCVQPRAPSEPNGQVAQDVGGRRRETKCYQQRDDATILAEVRGRAKLREKAFQGRAIASIVAPEPRGVAATPSKLLICSKLGPVAQVVRAHA